MADAILRMTKPGLVAEPQRAVKVASSSTQHQLKSAVHPCVTNSTGLVFQGSLAWPPCRRGCYFRTSPGPPVTAIHALAASRGHGRRRSLIQMATGAGKTYNSSRSTMAATWFPSSNSPATTSSAAENLLFSEVRAAPPGVVAVSLAGEGEIKGKGYKITQEGREECRSWRSRIGNYFGARTDRSDCTGS
jgi:hypothetical protein